MNRPGQPQQRPPSLAPNPGLPNQFRPPYPGYGLPPRNVNVLQAGGYVPGLQPTSHRTSSQQPQTQSMLPQPNPGFMQQQQQRAQSSFAFGGGLGQHQSTNSLQQQQQQQPPSQQQTNGASNSLPPHLSQTNLAGAPSVSSANDIGLDPNDFPALGSVPSSNNPNNNSGPNISSSVASYATQAGNSVPLGVNVNTGAGALGGGSGTTGPTREFTPDDFPALGGQTQSSQTASQQESHPHPPGLNGFQQHNDHSQQQQQQQHRQSLTGQLGASIQQSTPGMLNLGGHTRIHPGFQQPGQSDSDKQQHRPGYALKLNQALHAAWSTPNVNTPPQPVGSNNHNGTHPTQNPASALLNGPPGVAQPAYTQQSQSTHPPGAVGNPSSGNANTNSSNHVQAVGSAPTTSASLFQQQQQQQHPQTPAQQILVSAADRWGLLGLLAMIKNASNDSDQGLTSVGTDLSGMGLDMSYTGNLYSTFITPWSDQSAAHAVEPDFHLPGCYAVQTQPPGPAKAATFSDETLFFMFYSSPRDALQEVAAQELWNRNWRFHKELRLWITKESGTTPSQKVAGGEQGQYTFWDCNNWTKERKEMTVLYSDLEEKNTAAFLQGAGLVLTPQAAATQSQAQSASASANQQQQQQSQQQSQSSQVPNARGGFQIAL